jgi:hypothetical protein
MPTCFVVQGFGRKTDFESGRVLDLDASYEVIKEAVEAAGYECVRADEIRTTRHIEAVMYEQLWSADLVIADLSTMNVNAFFELGVRFALRPATTIVVAEDKIVFPFDVNHIPIRTYVHLGEDIGRKEAKRFIEVLTGLIEAIEPDTVDSPVFTLLPSLPRPDRTDRMLGAVLGAEPSDEVPAESLADLKRRAKAAMAEGRFAEAAGLWAEARERGPKDDHVVQQQALATYKAAQPTELEALGEAARLLEYLWPRDSLDPETLGLWAAVHKRIHALTADASALDEAIAATERGFVLGRDHYNGINLAYLLDVRARSAETALAREDHARAMSIRRQVLELCEARLEGAIGDDRYWVLASLWEAAVGIGDEKAATRWEAEAAAVGPAAWMLESTSAQVEALALLRSDLGARVGF